MMKDCKMHIIIEGRRAGGSQTRRQYSASDLYEVVNIDIPGWVTTFAPLKGRSRGSPSLAFINLFTCLQISDLSTAWHRLQIDVSKCFCSVAINTIESNILFILYRLFISNTCILKIYGSGSNSSTLLFKPLHCPVHDYLNLLLTKYDRCLLHHLMKCPKIENQFCGKASLN